MNYWPGWLIPNVSGSFCLLKYTENESRPSFGKWTSLIWTVSSAKKYYQMNWRSSHLVKNLNTFLSWSRNYFYDGTLPPPSFFSRNSRSSGSFFGGIGLHETTKLSSGALLQSGCAHPRFYNYWKNLLDNSYENKCDILLDKIKRVKITYNKEFSSILIAVINSYSSTANSNIKTNLEVSWLKRHIRSILLNNYLSLQESTLWCSWVYLFWFGDQDWSIFKEIVDDQFSNSVVFKSWLYNWFFEESEKAKYLF